MYLPIIAIGYGYIILMMTISAESLWSGLAVFVGLGLVPMYFMAKLLRRRAKPVLGQIADQPDREHPGQDQDDLRPGV